MAVAGTRPPAAARLECACFALGLLRRDFKQIAQYEPDPSMHADDLLPVGGRGRRDAASVVHRAWDAAENLLNALDGVFRRRHRSARSFALLQDVPHLLLHRWTVRILFQLKSRLF